MKIVITCILICGAVLTSASSSANETTTPQKTIPPMHRVDNKCYFLYEVDCLWTQNGNKMTTVQYSQRTATGKNTTDCTMNLWNWDYTKKCSGLLMPKNMTVEIGQTVYLSCYSTIAKSCSWTRNDQPIALEKKDRSACSIQIKDIEEKDLGIWECYVRTHLEQQEGLKRAFNLTLNDQEQPLNDSEGAIDDSNISIDTNSSIKYDEMQRKTTQSTSIGGSSFNKKYTCKFNNEVDCLWKKDGNPLNASLYTYVTGDGKYTLDCSVQARNPEYAPIMDNAECYGETKWEDLAANIGRPRQLVCYNEEDISCLWSKDGKIVEASSRYQMQSETPHHSRGRTCILIISSFITSDFGKWKCYNHFRSGVTKVVKAYNVILSTSKIFETTEKTIAPAMVSRGMCYFLFEVDCVWISKGKNKYDPRYNGDNRGKSTRDCSIVFHDEGDQCFGLLKPNNVTVEIGESIVELSCYTPGAKSCSWTRNGKPVALGRNDSDACALQISPVERKDLGIWKCHSQTVLDLEEGLKRIYKLSLPLEETNGQSMRPIGDTAASIDESNVSTDKTSSTEDEMERLRAHQVTFNKFQLKTYTCKFSNAVNCCWRKNGEALDDSYFKYVDIANGTNTTDCTVQLRHPRYASQLDGAECFGQVTWQTKAVSKGSSHKLHCSDEGHVICYWTKDEIPVEVTDRHHFHQNNLYDKKDDCFLIIYPFHESDVGKWKCNSYFKNQNIKVMKAYNVVLSSKNATNITDGVDNNPKKPLIIREQCQFPFEVSCVWTRSGLLVPLEQSQYVDKATNTTMCLVFGSESYKDLKNVECSNVIKTNRKLVEIGDTLSLECFSALTNKNCSWKRDEWLTTRKFDNGTCAIKIKELTKGHLGIWECYTRETLDQRELLKRRFNLSLVQDNEENHLGDVGSQSHSPPYMIAIYLCMAIIVIGVIAFIVFRYYYQGRRIKDLIRLQPIN